MTTPATGPLIVAVGGGKGGVGKSAISANLAAAMARQGFRVTAVDADLGSANLHTMLGVDDPGPTLHGLLEGRLQSLEEAVVATPVPRLFLVPGSNALPGSANLAHARKLKLIRHIRKLDTDAVVVDCGAGIGFNVIDFFNLADRRLLVATPQLVSLQNCYGFVKACAYRGMRACAQTASQRELLKATSSQSETERVSQLLPRVRGQDPQLADVLEHFLGGFGVTLLGNMLDGQGEHNPLHAIARMVRDFLAVEVDVFGGIRRTPLVHGSVSRRRPFICDNMTDPAARGMMRLAAAPLATALHAVRARPAERGQPTSGAPGALADDKSLPGPLATYEREHERFAVDWEVELRLGDAKHQGEALDVSCGGARLMWVGEVEPGDAIQVTFAEHPDLGAFEAQVIHLDGNTRGVQFRGSDVAERTAELVRRAQGEAPVRSASLDAASAAPAG